MIMMRVLVLNVVAIKYVYATLDMCNADCGRAQRKGLCPVRDAPVQIFDGIDGFDLHFDLFNYTLNMTSCDQTNISSLSWHWLNASGQGYVTRGSSLDRNLVNINDAYELNISSGFGRLALTTLNLSTFSYYGQSISTLYVYDFGGILLSTSSDTNHAASLSFSSSVTEFLRSLFWPNLFLCPLCTNRRNMRIFYQRKDCDHTADTCRLVISFAPEEDKAFNKTQIQYEIAFYLHSGVIEMSWANVTSANATFIIGLSHGIVPEWKSLAYDSLDFSSTHECVANPNCTVEQDVRPIGRTRPPNTRTYPYALAPSLNPSPEFCQLGCSFYYVNWTVSGCKALCDDYFNYDITCAYNDRAEMARYECYDGCDLGHMRCQPGYYCFQGIMRECPAGTYRDLDYYHTTRCDECSHGRYRETVAGRYLESCDTCSVGRYLPFTGSKSRYDCTLCPPGRFANEPGMQQCKCLTQLDGTFQRDLDQSIIYPDCDPEDYLDDYIRPILPSIDWSPRTTYP
mmetsp:Transcript_17962/g.27011  ORF Transcript_17962/g.27011 Transcript_17962/m.27011 type:complete len:512 (+) Transcript_17962:22-1557(+)